MTNKTCSLKKLLPLHFSFFSLHLTVIHKMNFNCKEISLCISIILNLNKNMDIGESNLLVNQYCANNVYIAISRRTIVFFFLILWIMAWNTLPKLKCLQFVNIAQILARNIWPYHYQYFQCKTNISTSLRFIVNVHNVK